VTESPETTMQMGGRLAPRDGWSAASCSIAAALDVLSTRSAFLILREAFYGAARFDEFVRRVEISEQVAAARLRDLVEHGLLDREPYKDPGQRARHRYRLSAKGADLFPVLVALMGWGDRWREDDGPPVELRHHACGARVGVELRCAAGHDVAPAQLVLDPTPVGTALLQRFQETERRTRDGRDQP
jgi:DNA-binding HxlR family transcriptional regulator